MLLGDGIKRVFVSGGAGFIGSHVVDMLVPQGYEVTAYDNLSNGHLEFIEPHIGKENFTFIEADLLDRPRLLEALKGHDLVWHLGANTDIIGGHDRPERDFHDCAEATFNVVEAMRLCGIAPILFSSSGAVYGDLCRDEAAGEAAGPLLPVGCYAAAKVACEAFISAYCHMYGLRGWVFRFGNVVGGRMTHGAIYDFIHKLRANPGELEVLGDGEQVKNYFLVEECIRGMAYLFRSVPMEAAKPCDIFNLGADSETPVVRIAEMVKEEMGLPDARVRIAGTAQAWPGDQARVHLDVGQVNRLGWRTEKTSDEAVRTAIRRMLGKETI